jgi:hypothetical protein
MDPSVLAKTPNAVQVTQAQLDQLMAGGRFFFSDSVLTPVASNIPLAQAKAAAVSTVDAAAENCRQGFSTPGGLQALVYAAKAAEASAFLALYATEAQVDAASPPVNREEYPFLSAEAGITGPNLFSVAQVISGLSGEWTAAAAAIEKLRLTAKKAIADATTIPEINAAMAVSWPTPG